MKLLGALIPRKCSQYTVTTLLDFVSDSNSGFGREGGRRRLSPQLHYYLTVEGTVM